MVLSHYDSLASGTAIQARKQVARLLELGHRVCMVTWQHDASLPRHERGPGWIIVRCPFIRWRGQPRWGRLTYPSAAIGLLALVLQQGRVADIIHAHQLLREAFLSCFAGQILRRPVVVKVASESDLPVMRAGQVYPPCSAQMLEFIRRTATVVAPARAIARQLELAAFPRARYIPNGVELRTDRERARRIVRDALAIPYDRPLVLFLGQLYALKGPDILLRAWPRVLAAIPEAILADVGNGQGAPVLHEQARSLGDAVRFHSSRVDGALWLAGADVVAVPSRVEGMSNALLEAMASATPCVATTASGSADMIVDGYNGRLVPVEDHEELADTIAWLLKNPAAAARLGAQGQETIAAGFTIETVVADYVRLYRELLGAGTH